MVYVYIYRLYALFRDSGRNLRLCHCLSRMLPPPPIFLDLCYLSLADSGTHHHRYKTLFIKLPDKVPWIMETCPVTTKRPTFFQVPELNTSGLSVGLTCLFVRSKGRLANFRVDKGLGIRIRIAPAAPTPFN